MLQKHQELFPRAIPFLWLYPNNLIFQKCLLVSEIVHSKGFTLVLLSMLAFHNQCNKKHNKEWPQNMFPWTTSDVNHQQYTNLVFLSYLHMVEFFILLPIAYTNISWEFTFWWLTSSSHQKINPLTTSYQTETITQCHNTPPFANASYGRNMG